jgi:3-mercaptopyruvate sulfurtransferase SseA
VALLLRKQGVKRIRPLQGGLEAWRKSGYAMGPRRQFESANIPSKIADIIS